MISSTAVQAERTALSWQWEYFEPFGVQFQVKVEQESENFCGKGWHRHEDLYSSPLALIILAQRVM
jgi:hypothetical protein